MSQGLHGVRDGTVPSDEFVHRRFFALLDLLVDFLQADLTLI